MKSRSVSVLLGHAANAPGDSAPPPSLPPVCVRARTNPRALQVLLFNMVVYLHTGPFARRVIAQLDEQIAAIDAGLVPEPALFSPAANDAVPAAVTPVRAVA